MDCTRSRIIAPPIDLQLGRWAESNLTHFIAQARHELDRGAGDPGMILSIGIALYRARQDVRDGLHRTELFQWEARPR
jgi:hypothetical protein